MNIPIPTIPINYGDSSYFKEGSMNKDKYFWVAIRDGEPCNTFTDRKEAVEWMVKLLKQTLKDLSPQQTTDDYDYDIVIPKIEIKFEKRETHLGL